MSTHKPIDKNSDASPLAAHLSSKSVGNWTYFSACAALLALGTAGVWVAVQPLLPDNTHAADTIDQRQADVSRMSTTSNLQPLTTEAPDVTTAVTEKTDCIQSLKTLAATAQMTMPAHLAPAREIARAAQGCHGFTIAVEGHSAQSDDEIENLRASWQQAEDTIVALAQEGLDVSAFQPLGFGSRALNGSQTTNGHISFHIASGS